MTQNLRCPIPQWYVAVHVLLRPSPPLAIEILTTCPTKARSVFPTNEYLRSSSNDCRRQNSESTCPAPALSLLLDENSGPPQGAAHPPPHTNNLSGPAIAIDPHEQVWQRLINHTVPQDELLPVVETLFSSRKPTDTVDRLRGSDAQALIDATDEAGRHTLHFQRSGSIYLHFVG